MTPQELLQEIEAVVAQMSEDDQVLWMRFNHNTTREVYDRYKSIDCDWHINQYNSLWSIWKTDGLFWVSSPNVPIYTSSFIEEASKELIQRVRTEWLPTVMGAQCKP